MDLVPINFILLKHPLNWFVVFFMVLLPLFTFVLVHNRLALTDQT